MLGLVKATHTHNTHRRTIESATRSTPRPQTCAQVCAQRTQPTVSASYTGSTSAQIACARADGNGTSFTVPVSYSALPMAGTYTLVVLFVSRTLGPATVPVLTLSGYVGTQVDGRGRVSVTRSLVIPATAGGTANVPIVMSNTAPGAGLHDVYVYVTNTARLTQGFEADSITRAISVTATTAIVGACPAGTTQPPTSTTRKTASR